MGGGGRCGVGGGRVPKEDSDDVRSRVGRMVRREMKGSTHDQSQIRRDVIHRVTDADE